MPTAAISSSTPARSGPGISTLLSDGFKNPESGQLLPHRSCLHEVLAPLLPPGSPIALRDFPSHANVGDSAIWLGQ